MMNNTLPNVLVNNLTADEILHLVDTGINLPLDLVIEGMEHQEMGEVIDLEEEVDDVKETLSYAIAHLGDLLEIYDGLCISGDYVPDTYACGVANDIREYIHKNKDDRL